jgi:hypothetical protein
VYSSKVTYTNGVVKTYTAKTKEELLWGITMEGDHVVEFTRPEKIKEKLNDRTH